MGVQTNQVRHMYVAKTNNVDATTLGNIEVKTDNSTTPANSTKLWFLYQGPAGPITSDYIIKGNGVKAVRYTAGMMERKLKSATVRLNQNIKDENGNVAPVAGQNYVVRLAISQFVDISDESIYTKYGVVAATTGMTANEFYATLALSFAKNFSREINKFFTFHLTYDDSGTSAEAEMEVLANMSKSAILKKTDSAGATVTFKGVKIVEVKQTDYVRGLTPMRPVYFKVYADDIMYLNDEVPAIEEVTLEDTNEAIGNGYDLADTEYFCMGERGDRLRMMGYPNVIPTKYLIDEEATYDVIEIHHSYLGRGVDYKQSEKDILIAIPTTATGVVDTIITALGTAGITVDQPTV